LGRARLLPSHVRFGGSLTLPIGNFHAAGCPVGDMNNSLEGRPRPRSRTSQTTDDEDDVDNET
ncbi:MAG: hypothetical protein RMK49_22165, partial [Abditibacteriales bacterium]|nr:hypothetical protein [Abditibacteriales bacterium]